MLKCIAISKSKRSTEKKTIGMCVNNVQKFLEVRELKLGFDRADWIKADKEVEQDTQRQMCKHNHVEVGVNMVCTETEMKSPNRIHTTLVG